MPVFSFEVTGERQVALKFDEFPQKAHEALLEEITDLTDKLEARVRSAAPDRTGALRRAITSTVFNDPERITGLVRLEAGLPKAEYGKAAALEYGAHGIAKVQQHYTRLDHVFARYVSPMQVIVQAYNRQVDIGEDDFLRGPLAAMEPEIMAGLQQALIQAGDA